MHLHRAALAFSIDIRACEATGEAMDGRDAQEGIHQHRAACVEQKIVNITRSNHEEKLQQLYQKNRTDDGGEVGIPFSERLEAIGEEKGKRHKSHDVSKEIQKRIIEIDVAPKATENINLIDAPKGDQIDKAGDVLDASTLGEQTVDRISASAERFIEQSYGEEQIKVDRKKDVKAGAEDLIAMRSVEVEIGAAIENGAGENCLKEPQDHVCVEHVQKINGNFDNQKGKEETRADA